MNEFSSLKELKEKWVSGEFEFPSQIIIAGIQYDRLYERTLPITDYLAQEVNPFLIYGTSIVNEETATSNDLNQWILFAWHSPDKVQLVPHLLETISPVNVLEKSEFIGNVVMVKVFLPSNVHVMKARVDTGAEISSLHADAYKIVGNTVQFTCKHISNNTITVPLADRQAVQSSDAGIEYRPVIELNIEVNGKAIRNCLFNLNDRSQMEFPMLIGQNVLEKTHFLIDPRRHEEGQTLEWVETENVNTTLIQEHLQRSTPNVILSTIQENYNPEAMHAIVAAMDNANVSFADLLRHLRTEALMKINTLEP